MNEKSTISDLLPHHHWRRIVEQFSMEDVAISLSLEDGLRVAYNLLCNENWDEELQLCAVRLLYKLHEFKRK